MGHFLVLARVLRFQGENEESGAGRTKMNFISNAASCGHRVTPSYGDDGEGEQGGEEAQNDECLERLSPLWTR